MLPLRKCFDTVLNGHIQTPCGAELFDTLLEALKDLDVGNTAGDIDYEWHGNVSKAHPYQPEDRRIRLWILHAAAERLFFVAEDERAQQAGAQHVGDGVERQIGIPDLG